MSKHSLNSSYREKLIEHLFIGEFLKISWLSDDELIEVSSPEVDNSGYDLVMEAHGVIRHVQLKAAFIGSSTANQKVHVSLAKKPSGCVIWVYFSEDTLELGPFLFFGGAPNEPLPNISGFKVARHTKGDAEGYKAERPKIRVINKGAFEKFESVNVLYDALFKPKAR